MNRDQKRIMRLMRRTGSPEGAATTLVQRLQDLEATVAEWERQARLCTEAMDSVRESDAPHPEAPATG